MIKHYFNIEVAKEVGINAAVVFENISFWVNHNAKTGRNERDGEYWTYGTQKDIAAQFEYLTIKQTRTALEKLEASGYIKTGNYNRHAYDRTRWFTLTEKGISISPKDEKVLPFRANGKDNKGEPIPDIKTDNKQKIDNERLERLKRLCGVS